MRTIIDIPDRQLRDVDALARRQSMSRAAIIREAVDAHLKKHKTNPRAAAFGLWKEHGWTEDGLAYQERMRSEW